jgi:ubiquinone/menaquinone biosynthesis C-methylase UbiE
MSIDLIQQYYDALVEREWERLERHPMEFAITRRALERWLPEPPVEILDCGSGPGRYALLLARQGYQLSLLDLSGAAIESARQRFEAEQVAYVSARRGNAADLESYPDGHFAAVLMLGPLYHLTSRADRYAALTGALRILKPGGILFAAFLSRYAVLRYTIRHQPELILEQPHRFQALLEKGRWSPERRDGTEFIAYSIHPTEVAPLIEGTGFRLLALLGLEGLTSHIDEKLNQADPQVWEAWVNLNYRLAQDESILGSAEHLLAVARKRY